MKPIHLKIKAFGPFSDEQIIDFSLLHDRSFFLIHGPTGAGKTSILDALCFALYGQTSISERSTDTLRSHHANPLVPTEVTLMFSIGNTVYRVFRMPEQDRPKSRGEGFTRKIAAATLERQTTSSQETQWNVIADRWNRVTEKIESILGFRCDQFRQIVLLPQGEFRKLLYAPSQDRQAILATLFKTEWYRYIEIELKNRAKEIKNEFDTLNTHVKLLLNDCSCDSLQTLTEKIASVNQECSILDNNIESVRSKEKQIQQLLDDARKSAAKFETLAIAKKEFITLESQKEYYDHLQEVCDQAEKALPLLKSREVLLQLVKEHENTQKRFLGAQADVNKAQVAFDKAQKNAAKIPDLQTRREELLSELEHIKSMLPKVQELNRSIETFNACSREYNECKLQLQATREHLDKVRVALKRLNDQSITLQEEISKLDTLKSELRSVEQLCSLEKRKDEIRKKITISTNVVESENKCFAEIFKTISAQKESIEHLEHLLYEGRAASLALTLIENTPCPVCGSLHHPHPAQSDNDLPDEKKIILLKKDLKKNEAQKELKNTTLESAQRTLADQKKELALLIEQSGNNEKDSTTLATEVKALTCRVAKVEESVLQLTEVRANIAKGENALRTAEDNVFKLTEKHTDLVAAHSSSTTLVRTLENGIPDSMRDLKSISEKEGLISTDISALQATIGTLRLASETTVKQLASCETLVRSVQEQVSTLKARLDNDSTAFVIELHAHGFIDENDFLNHVKSASDITDMKLRLKNFSNSFHSALDRKIRASAECENIENPDLKSIESTMMNIQNEIASSIRSSATLHHEQERLLERKNDLLKLNKKIELNESEYAIIGHLANVSSGENPQRITFERFILATLLDEVLDAGTRRLTVMSQSRYMLHRAQTHSDQRTAGGLDLMVFDSYTGTSRPVDSLSGGESFLAALSLALGLADVVQSYAGGIHLDTLFIDEGFGSLDSEALDCAFQALTDLGRNGRLVGIISHVSELKERIDTRLEILSGKNGSSVKFNFTT